MFRVQRAQQCGIPKVCRANSYSDCRNFLKMYQNVGRRWSVLLFEEMNKGIFNI